MYTIRSEDGLSIAQISGGALDKIIFFGNGKRVAKKFNNSRYAMCYVFNKDSVYETPNLHLFLWAGSYIELFDIE